MSRRGFLGAAGGVTAAAGIGASVAVDRLAAPGAGAAGADPAATEPFYGPHQGGITTPPQRHTTFVALDVTSDRRRDVAGLLRRWTATAGALSRGAPPPPAPGEPADSGEAVGLGPARLTVNVGVGPSLFSHGTTSRFGLGPGQPWQLVDLPSFEGDDLDPAATGGDLSLHACADDPQVVFHAVRALLRQARGVARVRWSQSGFNEAAAAPGTPRNLLGFKDGTMNPTTAADLDRAVWVGGEGPDWMTGGTYLVVRRIRLDLAAWDALEPAAQERIIGRHKGSGAPLGATLESDPLDLRARTAGGEPVIPADAHVRLAAPSQNWDATILRRSYAYANPTATADGAAPSPGAALDAGLLFCSYQRNPRLSFVPIYRTLAGRDALRRFTRHTASAVFALPRGVAGPGRYVGDELLA
ncbi:MAG TPA: Dyp-type peroxidase [Acidimicrobiales bacterium]|nr:Dyp-type peroxidase [Acidimicrobiales bacterium]